MGETDILIMELVKTTEKLGLSDVLPEILNDAGNLIVRLNPYPIVARISKQFPGDSSDFLKAKCLQELKIAKHLMMHKVPVVSLAAQVPPGPHKIGSTWMTLWEYIAPTALPPLEGRSAIKILGEMIEAMNAYNEPLKALGAWGNACEAVENLKKLNFKDGAILRLLQEFEIVNNKINNVKLYAAHGDAHPKNLIPSSKGWLWIDFEDVSLMPRFWDFASFIGNATLFHGLKHPNVDYILKLKSIAAHKPSFQFALKARVVMSITTNLSLALSGNGDLNFALSQLSCFNDFLFFINEGF